MPLHRQHLHLLKRLPYTVQLYTSSLPMSCDTDRLRREIAQRESELAALKSRLAVAVAVAETDEPGDDDDDDDDDGSHHQQAAAAEDDTEWKWPLREHEYLRYSRQMIVPDFGLQGQLKIRKAKVLVVGAGGLGCPAAAYLAGAGVGVLGLVDGDAVEMSNLHRQVAHSTSRVGMSKVESAMKYLKELNPSITYKTHATHLTPQNAAAIIAQYDLVLDCTDRPASRYLVSDACVLLAKPLVSASALQTSGQLLRLNCPPGRGPCYRCVFPRPPPPESVVGCAEGGILGPVVGTMGVLQALEAIKIIITRGGENEVQEDEEKQQDEDEEEKTVVARPAKMLLFSAMADDDAPFRTVRLRGRRDDCFACGSARKRQGGGGDGDGDGDDDGRAALTLQNMSSSLDYVQFCGGSGGGQVPTVRLRPTERITASAYARIVADEYSSSSSSNDNNHDDSQKQQQRSQNQKASSLSSLSHLLIDVREKEHFSLSSIAGSVNVPMSRLMRTMRPPPPPLNNGDVAAAAATAVSTVTRLDWIPEDLPASAPIYVVCRVGNDSQVATRKLKELLGLEGDGDGDGNGQRFIGDIDGGLWAWRRDVDPTMPFI